MTFATLLAKLMELETAVSVGNLAGARSLAFEAQDMLLQMERETIEDLRRRSYDKQLRGI